MINKGTLYWITGLSGAGKTTIGNRLYYKMKLIKSNTIILDGDILRKITGNDLGYGKEERLERAYRYNALCKLLTDQGMNVIICTIAMFDEVRKWNRDHIENYIEIFLNVEIEVLKTRNRKGLYSGGEGNIVGIDIEAEYPKSPDIVINNNDRRSLEEGIQRILNYKVIHSKRGDCDQEYWDNYYKSVYAKYGSFKIEPNPFAQRIFQKYMKSGKDLIELGCGNGGDSLYFAQNGINVLGVDSSEVVIQILQDTVHLDNCTFICEDFVSAETIYQVQYDYCYSRCSLQAINEQMEKQILHKVYHMIKKKGYFFIETKSTHDKKINLENEIEKNNFVYEEPYERYINRDKLESELKKIGFTVVECMENEQFESETDKNTTCIQMVVQKI